MLNLNTNEQRLDMQAMTPRNNEVKQYSCATGAVDATVTFATMGINPKMGFGISVGDSDIRFRADGAATGANDFVKANSSKRFAYNGTSTGITHKQDSAAGTLIVDGVKA